MRYLATQLLRNLCLSFSKKWRLWSMYIILYYYILTFYRWWENKEWWPQGQQREEQPERWRAQGQPRPPPHLKGTAHFLLLCLYCVCMTLVMQRFMILFLITILLSGCRKIPFFPKVICHHFNLVPASKVLLASRFSKSLIPPPAPRRLWVLSPSLPGL